MSSEQEISMNDMKMNNIEDEYIKKDLKTLGNLIAKMFILIIVVEGLVLGIGNLIIEMIRMAGVTIDSEVYLLFSFCVGTLLSNILAYRWLMKRTKTSHASLVPNTDKIRKDIWKYICILFTIGLIGTLCYEGIQAASRLAGFRWGDFGMEMPAFPEIGFIPYFLLVCLIAPITEEFVFRRAILKALSPYGARIAIIISALLFGIIHANLEQIPSAFLAGILLGYVTVRTGTIYYAIILHIINNTLSVLIGLGDNATSNSSVYNIVVWGIYITFGLIGVVFLIKDRKEYLSLKGGKYDDVVIPVRGGAFKYFFKSIWIWILIVFIIIGCINSITLI